MRRQICPREYNCPKSLPPAYVVRREGNSFTLFVSPHLGGGGQVQPPGAGGVRSSQGGVRSSRGGSGPARGGGQVQPAGGGVRSSRRGGGQVQLGGGSGPAGGVRSSQWGGGVRSSRGGGQVRGGSASCALLRALCLLRSRRRTFLFCQEFTKKQNKNKHRVHNKNKILNLFLTR